MRQAIVVILMAAFFILIGAKCTPPEEPKQIDFEANGFQVMNTTAYCCGTVTANGSKVHEGGCASSIERIGMVAIIYTLDGEFLGYFEVNDTGKQGGGVRNGTVADIYRSDYDRAVEWMETTDGKCWIKFVDGHG